MSFACRVQRSLKWDDRLTESHGNDFSRPSRGKTLLRGRHKDDVRGASIQQKEISVTCESLSGVYNLHLGLIAVRQAVKGKVCAYALIGVC